MGPRYEGKNEVASLSHQVLMVNTQKILLLVWKPFLKLQLSLKAKSLLFVCGGDCNKLKISHYLDGMGGGLTHQQGGEEEEIKNKELLVKMKVNIFLRGKAETTKHQVIPQ